MEPLYIQCQECQHFREVEFVEQRRGPGKFIYTCRAFPKGIPIEIRQWREPHVAVREDQVGNFIFDQRENLGV